MIPVCVVTVPFVNIKLKLAINMIGLSTLCFVASGFVLVTAQYQVPLGGGHESPFSHSFDELVSHNLDYWHVPGVSFAVVDGNETYSKVCVLFSVRNPT